MVAKKPVDDLDPPQFVVTEKDAEPTEEEKDLLPSENVDPDLLAEGTMLPAKTEDAALRVLGGEFGSSESAQRRRLIRAGFKPGAVMAEVRRLSS